MNTTSRDGPILPRHDHVAVSWSVGERRPAGVGSVLPRNRAYGTGTICKPLIGARSVVLPPETGCAVSVKPLAATVNFT